MYENSMGTEVVVSLGRC